MKRLKSPPSIPLTPPLKLKPNRIPRCGAGGGGKQRWRCGSGQDRQKHDSPEMPLLYDVTASLAGSRDSDLSPRKPQLYSQ